MKISLIHPSRGRAQKALTTRDLWFSKAVYPNEIEHIIAIDRDDAEEDKYISLFSDTGSNIICSESEDVVSATNMAAKDSRGDVLIYLSDDFHCPQDWDVLIFKEFNFVAPMLLKVDDCLQPFNRQVLTIPIMNRVLYLKLGSFFNPLYKSQWCDSDLYQVCKKNNWLYSAPELKFPHNHYSIGKSEKDEIYERNDANYESGKQIFIQRQIEGFSI